ncbi:HNH endonuclease signature motif containing protein [Streptomyces flavofungini]|uniref:HNH endonuclease n=1 Tax=Streptomyces flavofungini TaxID=68200 RepID=A0ABS0XFU7_9ACTN|nr:HNH endonuclease signature motif containing protein [Streptomyces flavofungini]MBJ3812082.1 HNH endonuclease [Streptomyces flavofungini]GHC44382.1 hypothetical protein GCM10010349_06250 [Streptomyces flavofungini]
MGPSPYTQERLAEAAASSRTLSEALGKLGVDPKSSRRAYIRERMKKLGVDTSHFVRENGTRRIKAYGIDTSHFVEQARTEAMRDNRRRRSPSEILVIDAPRRVPSTRLKRAMTELGAAEQCALCGIGPTWLGEPLTLEVDHIGGDWRNNRIENLRLLCPNCHSTTDTYRGRAKRRRS